MTATATALTSERLLELASERTGLTDFGDLPFRDGIDVRVLEGLSRENR